MKTSQNVKAPADLSIGRIVSVTGSKAIVLLDGNRGNPERLRDERPVMGTLLAIDTAQTIVLAIVSALSVPVPAQREGDSEIWIAELGLCGELWRDESGRANLFARGVTVYPALGDRVRVNLRSHAFGHKMLRLWIDHAILFRHEVPGGFRLPCGLRCGFLNAAQSNRALCGGQYCYHVGRSILCERTCEADFRHPDEVVGVGLQSRRHSVGLFPIKDVTDSFTAIGR